MMNCRAARDDASKWKSRRWVEISDGFSNSYSDHRKVTPNMRRND